MYLSWNDSLNKWGIVNGLDLWVLQGLHDGDKLEVKINDEWVNTIINYHNDEWYLCWTDVRGNSLQGLEVKIRYKFG